MVLEPSDSFYLFNKSLRSLVFLPLIFLDYISLLINRAQCFSANGSLTGSVNFLLSRFF